MNASALLVVPRLGVANVIRVLWYRFSRWSRIVQFRTPVGSSYPGPFIRIDLRCDAQPFSPAADRRLLDRVRELANGELRYFSCARFQVGSPPDWHADPFEAVTVRKRGHWASFREFDDFPGDVKCVWEASRFEWALDFARAHALTGDPSYLVYLNRWIENWVEKNPCNTGPNWMCGQESSIRLMHLLLALRVIAQHRNYYPAACQFAEEHCRRIEATMHYAVAQDNNHGTSEAAALFAAGAWLSGSPSTRLARLGHRWAAIGRMRLEERVRRLVASDGSFSQYSTNYHRLLVDTLSNAEFWRRECDAPPFSDAFYRKGRAAIAWLSSMVDSISGDVPNIGANDGARLFRLTETSYRDFRPSVQLASSLFNGRTVYARGDWDEALRRLSVTAISGQGEKTSKVYTDGGYAVFVASDRQSWGVLRFPKFRFRPSHADALHLDLWCNGTNLVRDGGTYSYHLSESLGPYFSGTASHSTCQFDERDQMPRLGRFLFGNWLATEELSELSDETNQTRLSASYVDSLGACHCREVRVTTGSWEIADEMKNYQRKAVLRWRLAPARWTLQDNRLKSSLAEFEISVEQGALIRCEVVEGWESRHYLERSKLPVLEIELAPPQARVRTTITLSK